LPQQINGLVVEVNTSATITDRQHVAYQAVNQPALCEALA